MEPATRCDDKQLVTDDWSSINSVTSDQDNLLELLKENVDLSSDEEKSIIGNIKNEIIKGLSEEMAMKLEVYKPLFGEKKPSALTDKYLSGLDPKVREGILNIRKLDRILESKTKKEREIKKSRILLQRKLKKELNELERKGRKLAKEEKTNTMKFLSLTLPPTHNIDIDDEIDDIGVEVDEEECSRPVTPVFQTQLPNSHHHHKERLNKSDSPFNANTSSINNSTGTSTKSESRSKKNYINRNIELAGDANQTVAMTDEEKLRVKMLLEQDDEEPFDETSLEEQTVITQLSLFSTDGYRPSENERNRLTCIDSQLKYLAPYEHIEKFSYMNDSMEQSEVSISTLLSRTDQVLYDVQELGENTLKSNKEDRELHDRIVDIDAELQIKFNQNLDDTESILSDVELKELLQKCDRNIGTIMEEDSFSDTLSELSIPLSRDVIDQLLYNNGLLTNQMPQSNQKLEITDRDFTSTRNEMFNDTRSFLPIIDPKGSSLTGINYNNTSSDRLIPRPPSTINE